MSWGELAVMSSFGVGYWGLGFVVRFFPALVDWMLIAMDKMVS
jgi:hypothetical protein